MIAALSLVIALLCVHGTAAQLPNQLTTLASPYIQAQLDPTVPSWTLTFLGYSYAQWYGEMDIQWLEERLPSGEPLLRLGFSSENFVEQYTTNSSYGAVQNVAMFSVFANNATVTTLGQYFANATTISYPSYTIDLVPQSFKISFNITNWPFQSMNNTLALGFRVSTSVSVFDMGADQYPLTELCNKDGQLRTAEIQGMFDWVRIDLFDFAVTQTSNGSEAYPWVGISVEKSSAFPPSASAEISFPAFQNWVAFDPTIQLVVAAPDRPQLMLLVVGILSAVLVCFVFGGLLAFACKHYRSLNNDLTPGLSVNGEKTSLLPR